jgi:hypothetical protein
MAHGSHGFNLSSIGWALLGLSFLPRKRVHSVKWSTLSKMQHADAKLWPSLHNLFMKVN